MTRSPPRVRCPSKRSRRRPNLSLELTERGGHLGFVGRGRGDGRAGARSGWLEETVSRYISLATHRATHLDSGVF